MKIPNNSTARDNIDNQDDGHFKELKYDFDPRPPPPEYPKWEKNKEKIVAEKYSLSKSQPDLSKIGLGKIGGDLASFKKIASTPRPKTKGREEYEVAKDEVENWVSSDMVDMLMQENTTLKLELNNCYQRVAKTQKVSHLYRLELEFWLELNFADTVGARSVKSPQSAWRTCADLW